MSQLIEYKLVHPNLSARYVYSQTKCEKLEANGYDLVIHKVIKQMFDYNSLNTIHQTTI